MARTAADQGPAASRRSARGGRARRRRGHRLQPRRPAARRRGRLDRARCRAIVEAVGGTSAGAGRRRLSPRRRRRQGAGARRARGADRPSAPLGRRLRGRGGRAWVLELFRREIDRALALGGWDEIAKLNPGVFSGLLQATGARSASPGTRRALFASDPGSPQPPARFVLENRTVTKCDAAPGNVTAHCNKYCHPALVGLAPRVRLTPRRAKFFGADRRNVTRASLDATFSK